MTCICICGHTEDQHDNRLGACTVETCPCEEAWWDELSWEAKCKELGI
jgi:hypothetical protein